jgi:Saccharopine dehydrogenase NADP binding domain
LSAKRPVVLYGASGFSGRLVAEFLREYKLPFIAAGRNRAKIEDAPDHVPGISTADYEVAEVAHSVDELAELFSGARVVCNTVGPCFRYGATVVEAALRAGCHYVDTGGETPWVAPRTTGASASPSAGCCSHRPPPICRRSRRSLPASRSRMPRGSTPWRSSRCSRATPRMVRRRRSTASSPSTRSIWRTTGTARGRR